MAALADDDDAARDQAILGAALRALRERAGLTQEQFGERAGLDATYLSQLENGHRGIRCATVMRMLRAAQSQPHRPRREPRGLTRPPARCARHLDATVAALRPHQRTQPRLSQCSRRFTSQRFAPLHPTNLAQRCEIRVPSHRAQPMGDTGLEPVTSALSRRRSPS
jgi:DNA-binding XRE family transcriptional regulator